MSIVFLTEAIVAESVVVIKKLLQTQPNEHKDIIAHMAKLMDFITVPQARASILWLLGEYSDRVPKIAPDVLRKMAKSFVNEQDIVKLQTLNLAVKLCLNNSTQTKPFCQYVFQLAKYDQNYDIRDRARFLRHFIFEDENDTTKKILQFAKRIFLSPKPAPTLTSRFKDSEYQLGTLSHYLDMPCAGYRPLPPFPEMTQDPSVRDVAPPIIQEHKEERHNRKEKERKKNKEKEKPFYSDEESTPAEGENIIMYNYECFNIYDINILCSIIQNQRINHPTLRPANLQTRTVILQNTRVNPKNLKQVVGKKVKQNLMIPKLNRQAEKRQTLKKKKKKKKKKRKRVNLKKVKRRNPKLLKKK